MIISNADGSKLSTLSDKIEELYKLISEELDNNSIDVVLKVRFIEVLNFLVQNSLIQYIKEIDFHNSRDLQQILISMENPILKDIKGQVFDLFISEDNVNISLFNIQTIVYVCNVKITNIDEAVKYILEYFAMTEEDIKGVYNLYYDWRDRLEKTGKYKEKR